MATFKCPRRTPNCPHVQGQLRGPKKTAQENECSDENRGTNPTTASASTAHNIVLDLDLAIKGDKKSK